jgi:uncharacterized protein YgbK (DUF1537 family)
VECLLIADDLTGACDAAVQFAARGRRAAVALAADAAISNPDILAVSTESRGLSVKESRRAIMDVALQFADTRTRILFKKIDSTLRGNAGAEIAATVEAFHCDLALITPAFPAMKRIVAAGKLCVEGTTAFEPIELGAYFRAQGLASHRHVHGAVVYKQTMAAAIADGVRFVSIDAVSDADLDAAVETMMESKSRILWAGSAGLAAALARSMSASRQSVPHPAKHRGPVLFCIGSTHPATVAQQRRLLAERPARAFSAEAAVPGEIAAALCGGNVVLEVPRGRIRRERLAELLTGVREAAGALALSGGDTASHVCRALHAHSIRLHDEVQTGIPWGTLCGGAMDGIAVATKSGGFGDSGALIEITDFFTCPKA